MNLTDRIYVIENNLDIFGEIIPTEEVALDCREFSRQLINNNMTSSSMENRYELKVYIPYRRTEPYASFGKKEYTLFRYEDVIYELVMKVSVKDFFGKMHHYEITLRELRDAE